MTEFDVAVAGSGFAVVARDCGKPWRALFTVAGQDEALAFVELCRLPGKRRIEIIHAIRCGAPIDPAIAAGRRPKGAP